MGQALYRTYRSRNFSEVVGQEHITDTLTSALKKGFISHAYLFTGPHGVGKTSIARILAHEINQLPYSDDSVHLDIIEIDAASNRRIDEIRDLREKVHIAPTSAKYKVYVIDEVHMLTREAFNALLKTLEEPPAHAVFILATTEAHKLPETIISRTQRFTFRPISVEKVMGHLREIAAKEKLKITDDALRLIAEHGGGTFRDSISVLDQMRSLGREVTAQDVASMLGIAPANLVQKLLSAVQNYDAATLTATLSQLQNQGAEAAQIAKQFGGLLRERFIANEHGLTHEQTIHLLTSLLDVPNASDPRLFLQITLLDIALSSRPDTAREIVQPPAAASPDNTTHKAAAPAAKKPAVIKAASTQAKAAATEAIAAAPEQTPILTEGTISATPIDSEDTTNDTKGSTGQKSNHTQAATAKHEDTGTRITSSVEPAQYNAAGSQQADNSEALSPDIWPKVLAAIKKNHSTLYSVVRMAAPAFAPGKITLEVGFPFHQKRINETRNRQTIAKTVADITGSHIAITCVLGGQKPTQPGLPAANEGEITHTVDVPKISSPASAPDTGEFDYYVSQAEEASARPLDTVNNIFGGGELLGS